MINSDQLLTKIQSYNKFSNPEILTKAFNFALDAHKDQKRISGAPILDISVAFFHLFKKLLLNLKFGLLATDDCRHKQTIEL